MDCKLPEKIMKDVYWAFTKGGFEDFEKFKKQVKSYHVRIKGENVWQPDEVVFPHPSIQISYEYWSADGEEEFDEIFEIEADNGNFLTAGELLFKINNTVAEKVSRGDHVFFEGLNLSENQHDGKAFYWMYLGS